MAQTFEHHFITPFGIIDIAGANGYIKCLTDFSKFINDNTVFGKPVSYIDSDLLMNKIHATATEIDKLMKAENI